MNRMPVFADFKLREGVQNLLRLYSSDAIAVDLSSLGARSYTQSSHNAT